MRLMTLSISFVLDRWRRRNRRYFAVVGLCLLVHDVSSVGAGSADLLVLVHVPIRHWLAESSASTDSSKVLQQVAPDKFGRLTWIAVDHIQEQKWGRIRSTAATRCHTKCTWAFALSTSSCTPCTSTVMPSGSPSRVEWLQARKGIDCGGRKAFGKSLRVARHSTCKNTGYEETSGAWLSYELGAVLDAAQRKS